MNDPAGQSAAFGAAALQLGINEAVEVTVEHTLWVADFM
jgi:hypothetical protein